MSAPTAEIAIINCSTKELTALALASALRHGGLPVTVIDCESTDGSVPYFRELQRQMNFKISHLPLRKHGMTLDRLFLEATCDRLLLLDSDAEILDPELVARMLAALRPGTYGSGFLHAGEWLGPEHGGGSHVGYYAERMWIPCVMLDVAAVRLALESGQSFRQRIVGNELQRPWLAQLLAQRFRVPGLRRIKLGALRPLRREYRHLYPHYIYCDTGAGMHDFLVNRRGMAFADLGSDWWPRAVAHYHGATRRQLRPRMRNAADVVASRADATARIAEIYGVRPPDA